MANLFDAVKVGDLELKHRIVMSPLTRSRAGENLAPREMNVEYYAQRSSAAIIITEATHVYSAGHRLSAHAGHRHGRTDCGLEKSRGCGSRIGRENLFAVVARRAHFAPRNAGKRRVARFGFGNQTGRRAFYRQGNDGI